VFECVLYLFWLGVIIRALEPVDKALYVANGRKFTFVLRRPLNQLLCAKKERKIKIQQL
jgi:hypothetical protein